jgi:hypothetical protein
MNQQQIEEWIRKQGGSGSVQYTSEKKRVANPAYAMTLPNGESNPQYQPGQPPTLEVASEMWVNSKTGAKLHVSRKDDNTFDVIENQGADPNKPPPATERPQTVATNTTEPYIVTRQPDGSLTSSKNPNYQQPKPDKPHITTHEGNLVSIDPATNAVTVISQGKPKEPVLVDLGGGRKGHATIGANGQVVVTDVTPPPPVDPAGAGPTMPQIILGHSQQALRDFKRQIQDEVAKGRKTQAWADAQWNDAFQVAQHVNNEAAIIQRENESNLNAQVNLATTKYTTQAKGLNDALTFVSGLNDKLPPGSDLGGKAFAALLGMQMMQAERSGIYDIKPPTDATGARLSAAGAQAGATASSRMGALASPPPAASAPPPAPAAAAPPPAAPAQVPPPAAPAAPPAAGAPATPNLVPPPPVPTPAPSMVTSTAPVAPGQTNVPLPPPGTLPGQGPAPLPHQMTPPSGSDPNAPLPWMPPTEMVVVQRKPGPGVTPGQPIRMTRAEWDELVRTNPGYANGDFDVTPEPSQSAGPTTPAAPANIPGPDPSLAVPPITMAPQQPANDFAALQAYQPMPAPQPQANIGQEPAAMLHAQAASTPPWRLDEATVNQMRAAGIPEDVILSPGRVAA